jgi:hypothetical protein
MLIDGGGKTVKPFYFGELFQNNVVEYDGKKVYQQCDMFKAVKAGSTEIELNTNYYAHKPGDRVLLFAGAFADHGYPPACTGEINKIKNIIDNKITFEWSIEYNYDENVIDIIDENGVSYGKPRLLNLDRPENPYDRITTFKNITIAGDFNYAAADLTLFNVFVKGWWWPSESRLIKTSNCRFANCEYDKLVKTALSSYDFYVQGATNGGSIETIEWNYNSAGAPVQLCPRYLTIEYSNIWNNTEWLESLSPYPAMNPIRRLLINKLILASGKESKAASHINIAPILPQDPHVPLIKRTEGKAIITDSFFYATTMEKGTILFAENGSDAGEVTSIEYDSKNKEFIIKGTWSGVPVGQWRWSYVKLVIDKGGHKVLDSKQLWNGNSIRWQGNQNEQPPYTMHLTEKDFIWPGSVTVDVGAYVESIEFTKKQAGSAQYSIEVPETNEKLLDGQINAKSPVYLHKPVKQLTLNTWGDFLTQIPKFNIILKWTPYA